jgi:hypothetical protein
MPISIMVATRDEKIEKVLQDLNVKKSIAFGDYIYDQFGDPNDTVNRDDCDKLVDIMLYNNLMCQTADSIYTITPEGIQIFESGGWIKHQANKLKEKLRSERIRNKEAEKLFWETKLVKWQVKAFWPLFLLAILGFLTGISSLAWQIIDKSNF